MQDKNERKGYIGAILRKARQNKGFTAKEVGEKLSPQRKGQTVTQWERGSTSPSPHDLAQLINLLEIDSRCFYQTEEARTEYYFVTLDDEKSEDVRHLNDCFSQMNDKQRKAVLAVASAMVD